MLRKNEINVDLKDRIIDIEVTKIVIKEVDTVSEEYEKVKRI